MLHTIYLISGILALAVSLTVFAGKSKRLVMKLKLTNDALWCINYFSEGSFAYTGLAQNLVCFARDLVFLNRAKDKKWAQSKVWCVLFCIFYAITPVITWTGPHCMLAAVSSLFSTFALFNRSLTRTRLLTIPSSIFGVLYNVFVHNVFGTLSNSFFLISIFIGFLRSHRGTVLP